MKLLVFVAITACSGPARWQPAPGFNALVVTDDIVLRGEADGSVSAAVTVALDSDRAVGTVRLFGTTIEDAARSPHLALARARGWQVLAKRLEMTVDRAFEAVRRGVAEIKSCCPNDTSMYLHAAELEPQSAATLARGQTLLSDLLAAYVRRNHRSSL